MAFVTTDTIMDATLYAPSGHSQSSVETALVSQTFAEQIDLTIAASAIVAATAAAGFDALFTQIDTDVQTWIDTTVDIDVVAKSVDYNAIVKNIVLETPADDIYVNDANRNYVVTVLVKVRTY